MRDIGDDNDYARRASRAAKRHDIVRNECGIVTDSSGNCISQLRLPLLSIPPGVQGKPGKSELGSFSRFANPDGLAKKETELLRIVSKKNRCSRVEEFPHCGEHLRIDFARSHLAANSLRER